MQLTSAGRYGIAGPKRGSAFASAIAFLRRIHAERAAARQLRETIEQLRSFDDRMLADIGIDRWEIDARIRGGRPR